MSTALAKQIPDQIPPAAVAKPAEWLAIEEAAALLGVSGRAVRERCLEWSRWGGAKKVDGATGPKWVVHRRAVGGAVAAGPAVVKVRTPGIEAAELELAGVKRCLVETALKRAAVLEDFDLWRMNRGKGLSDGKARIGFVRQRRQSGETGERLSVRSLMRWQAAYDRSGLAGLVPAYRQCRETEAEVDPRAVGEFEKHYLTEAKLPVAEVWQVLRGQAMRQGWGEIPSLRWWQRYVRDKIPEDVKILRRKGDRKFNAEALHKVQRDYTGTPANHTWSGDERRMDILCRVPARKGGWRRIRPILTAWLDIRSRVFVGWFIGEHANSDTILAAAKMGALQYGLPQHVYIDNGSDYKAVGGKRRRRRSADAGESAGGRVGWDDFNEKRFNTVFSALDIQATYAREYQAWSKMIESHFGTMQESFDRWHPSYTGNSPEDRPSDAMKIPVEELPTLNEVRASFDKWLQGHHEKPQSTSGMDGLSPRQAMDAFKGTKRDVSEKVLNRLMSRKAGPRVVGKDGVRWNNLMWGQLEPAVWSLHKKRVWLLIPPDDLGTITLVGEDGNFLVEASNEMLRGVTLEDVRESAKSQARRKRQAREFYTDYVPRRHFTKLDDVWEAKLEAARSDQLPDPEPSPEAGIIKPVRPDLEKQNARLEETKAVMQGREAMRSVIHDGPVVFNVTTEDVLAMQGETVEEMTRGAFGQLLENQRRHDEEAARVRAERTAQYAGGSRHRRKAKAG